MGRDILLSWSGARKIAKMKKVKKHFIVSLDFSHSDSPLTNKQKKISTNRARKQNDIPATYVPARNTIFLSYALSYAESLKLCDIFIGANAVDYSGYPDCRPKYIQAYQAMANLATKNIVSGKKITIHTPLITMTKSQIIKLGAGLGLNFKFTTSCYDPAEDGEPCGRCESCLFRAKRV